MYKTKQKVEIYSTFVYAVQILASQVEVKSLS